MSNADNLISFVKLDCICTVRFPDLPYLDRCDIEIRFLIAADCAQAVENHFFSPYRLPSDRSALGSRSYFALPRPLAKDRHFIALEGCKSPINRDGSVKSISGYSPCVVGIEFVILTPAPRTYQSRASRLLCRNPPSTYSRPHLSPRRSRIFGGRHGLPFRSRGLRRRRCRLRLRGRLG